MGNPALTAAVKRILEEPAFRGQVASEPGRALAGQGLSPTDHSALQELARSEVAGSLDGLSAAARTADQAEISRKMAEVNQAMLDRAQEQAARATEDAKEAFQEAHRLIVDTMERNSQAVHRISSGLSSGGRSSLQIDATQIDALQADVGHLANPAVSWGGAGAEALESARRQAPEGLHHRERAVSAADFDSIASKVPAVRIGRASVAAGAMVLIGLVAAGAMISQIQGPRDRIDLVSILRDRDAVEKPPEEAESGDERPAAVSQPEDPTAEPTATATPAPLAINFNADQYTIEEGQCTTLRWIVENANSVRLGTREVEATEAERTCPGQSTWYYLTASQGTEEQVTSLQIEVVQPQQVSGPGPCWHWDDNNQLICYASCPVSIEQSAKGPCDPKN